MFLAGQVSLNVKVQALKLEPELVPAASPLSCREWISLEDVQVRLASLTRPKPLSIQPLEIDDGEADQPQKQCCLCACFSRLFSTKPSKYATSKGKGSEGKRKGSNQAVQQQMTLTSPPPISSSSGNLNGNYATTPAQSSLCHEFPTYASMRTPKENRHSVASLRNLANTVQEKSELFYQILRDPNTTTRESVVKYLEQDRGVLVVETNATSPDGVMLGAICMKMDQLVELRRYHSNGKLAQDLQNLLVTDKLLEQVGATAIHLEVEVNSEEFDLAEQELSS